MRVFSKSFFLSFQPLAISRKITKSIEQAVGGTGFVREVTTFEELVAALRDRRVDIDLTQAELDQVTGLTSGYTSHIEAPGSNHGRRMGNVSLPLFLRGLGVKLLMIEDPAGLPKVAETVRVGERRKGTVLPEAHLNLVASEESTLRHLRTLHRRHLRTFGFAPMQRSWRGTQGRAVSTT